MKHLEKVYDSKKEIKEPETTTHANSVGLATNTQSGSMNFLNVNQGELVLDPLEAGEEDPAPVPGERYGSPRSNHWRSQTLTTNYM